MDDVFEGLLDRYEIITIDRAELRKEREYYRDKYTTLTKELEELSRTVSVLKKTLTCHEDYLKETELYNDFDRFKDKWLEGEN